MVPGGVIARLLGAGVSRQAGRDLAATPPSAWDRDSLWGFSRGNPRHCVVEPLVVARVAVRAEITAVETENAFALGSLKDRQEGNRRFRVLELPQR